MRWMNGLAVAAMIAALVGSAAMFGFLAPENYGLPPIEVSEPGPTGVRVDEAGLFGNYYPADGEGPHPGILLIGGSEGGLGRGVTWLWRYSAKASACFSLPTSAPRERQTR
jgi:uncharacterized protein